MPVVTHQVVLRRGRKIDSTMNGLYLGAKVVVVKTLLGLSLRLAPLNSLM